MESDEMANAAAEEMTDWFYWKNKGICPTCQRRKSAPGRVRCCYCLQKNRILTSKIYARHRDEIQEKRSTPENMSLRREKDQTMRTERKEKGLCVACGKRRAAHGVLCKKCWERRRELRREKSIYTGNLKDHSFRHNLPIPEAAPNARKKNVRKIGEIISLYNAGWTEKEIVDETGICLSTVSRYITKAKEMQKQQDKEAEI